MINFAKQMRKIYCIMTIALLVCSCNRGQIGKALTDLDEVIRQAEVFDEEFSQKADELRKNYHAVVTDEQKWSYADSLYNLYYCNSLDSSLFYLGQMRLHAVSAQQKLRTRMSELTISMARMNNEKSLEGFHSLDTAGLLTDDDVRKAYYSAGIALYYQLYKSELPTEEKVACRQTLQALRAQYIYLDTESFYAQKIIAQYDRDNGDYQAALDRFMDIYVRETDHHERASTAYNIATIDSWTFEQKDEGEEA